MQHANVSFSLLTKKNANVCAWCNVPIQPVLAYIHVQYSVAVRISLLYKNWVSITANSSRSSPNFNVKFYGIHLYFHSINRYVHMYYAPLIHKSMNTYINIHEQMSSNLYSVNIIIYYHQRYVIIPFPYRQLYLCSYAKWLIILTYRRLVRYFGNNCCKSGYCFESVWSKEIWRWYDDDFILENGVSNMYQCI